MSDHTSDYNLKAIRKLLLEAFTAEDLRRFCLDDPSFRPICERISQWQLQIGCTQLHCLAIPLPLKG
jgi:hypothetical protein